MTMLRRKVFMYIIITLEVIICQKDSDEGRPYEFGFTIDGQQHRHEKKDQNGIIQGEFGFITADGVYHVTVYATDENGDFKILSMKNIRISAPLDGSPALGPISPEASKYLKKANLPNQIQPAKPQSTTPQKFERVQEPPSLAVTQKAIVSTQKVPYVFTTLSTIGPACGGCGLITTPKPGSKFTFQNPAFSQPNTNNQRVPVNQKEPTLDIQNRFSDTGALAPGYNSNFASSGKKASQAFDKELNSDGRQQNSNTGFRDSLSNSQFQQQNKAGNAQLYNSNVNPITGEKSSQTIDKVGNFDSPQQKPQSEFKNPVGYNQFQQNNGYANTAGNIQRPDVVGSVGQRLSSTSNNVKSFSGNKAFGGVQSFGTAPVSNGAAPKGIQSFGNYQQSESSGGNYGPVDQNRAGPNLNFESVAGQTDKGSLSQDEFGRLLAPPINSNGPNPLLRPQDVSKLPPVVVSDNVIHVMGKKPVDIPIKDKYPGMVDGLPKGVEVKDVTKILYKFKYTVGFHGHYEKGLKDGSKIGGYFVNGRDGISRIVTYVADENGYRPKFKFINLGLDSPDTPNEKTEKTFGLKDFEFVWYPVE